MAKFSINRPSVAIVIAITVIAGAVAMTKLPIAQLPDLVPPQVSVSAVYTGAASPTIEQSVATPLEQQLSGVDNMRYKTSTNANNVFAQIGLVMLIGLTARNAIWMVEFAVLKHKNGRELVDAALEGVRLRLRPIFMTAFAFILGCVPLGSAKGAGAIGRKVLGSAEIMGMLAPSVLGIFLVSVLFVVVERFAKKRPAVGLPNPAVLSGGND